MYKMLFHQSICKKWPYIIIVVTIFIFCLPIFTPLDTISMDDDWLTVYFHHNFIRNSILQFHQMPLWSPYICGGYPVEGYPEYPMFQPLVLSSLILGEVIGLKLNVLLFYLVGAISMYYLTRKVLAYSQAASLYSSMLLVFSSWLPWATKDGNYIEMYYFLFPMIITLYIKAIRANQKKYLIYLACLLSLIIFDGNVVFLAVVLFLFIFAFLNIFTAANKKIHLRPSSLFVLIPFCILALGLAGVKIVPMIKMLIYDNRSIDDYHIATALSYTFSGLKSSLLNQVTANKGPLPESRIFIGAIPLCLAIASIISRPIRNIKWIIALFIAVLLVMGHNAPVDIFRWLWHAPLYHSMHKPAKYYDFFIIFNIALLGGSFISSLQNLGGIKKAIQIGIILVSFSALVPIYVINRETNADAFIHKKPTIKQVEMFYQIEGQGLPRYDSRTPKSNYYFNLLRNIGTIDWKSNIVYPENAEPRYYVDIKDNLIQNNYYQGEVFCDKSGNRATIDYFSPNEIVIDADMLTSGIVVLNQNYNKSWYSSQYQLFSYNGLIGIRVDSSGHHAIKLQYSHRNLIAGAIVSLFSIVVACYMKRKYEKK